MKNTLLKSIFSSNTRVKLFSWFFLQPGGAYYARQLEKELKTPVSQLRRELLNLEKCGFLFAAREGNQVRYSANKNFVIYDELRSLFLKTGAIGDVLIDALKPVKGVELAFVYGSYAAGDEHAGSDIDLMVVGNVMEKELRGAVAEAEKRLHKPVNYSLYEKKEVEKKLAKKDNFITGTFNGPKFMLKGSTDDRLFRTAK
jgi:uncharacterized protein